MKILKLQLNYTDEKVHVPNISFDFEDPQQYIDKKSENQDETTIQKYTAKVKSESDKWISFYEEKLTNHRQVYMKYCKYWEILKTEIKKEKCDVDFKKKKDIYSHRNSCTINLEETCRVWQIEMSKIEMDYEKEIAAHEAEFKRLKESYEQEYTQACEEIRRISEHRKALNKDICNCKLEIYKFHLERELLINNQKSSLDHQNSKASIRETAVNKFKKSTERSLCENYLLDARVDTQTEDECKHSFGIKICKIKKCQNYKISLNLKSEESRFKKILQLLIDKQEKESEIKKQFAKRHEKTLEYASIFLRDIESSDCKFKKVMNERYQKFNEIVQKHICIINASRSDKIRRFEVDMKNKENQKIIEIKTTLLHQFLRSTQTQLAILENKKILQENLVKEVQSSLDWKACAIKHINCYLLETKQVWRDMESCCSRLMKHMVAKNLIEHRNCTANNTLSKAIKLKYNQQISIFKKQAKQFCEKCEALVNNFDLLDNSFTMIRETISLLIVSKHN